MSRTFFFGRPRHSTADQREARYGSSVLLSKEGFGFAPSTMPTADQREAHHASVLPRPPLLLALLPFALFYGAVCSGASWCPQFHNGCCYLDAELNRFLAVSARSAGFPQSPELGDCKRSNHSVYAAAFLLRSAILALRNGSYTSPVTHNRCSNTASFRATATIARFLAFLPPRSASLRPHRFRSVSGLRDGPGCNAPPAPAACADNSPLPC